MLKNILFKINGMLRDLSVSAFNPEYAYENKNIRIMPTNESTLLSIINEKGTKRTYIDGVGDSIKGIPIGLALVNNELVLFTCGDKSELNLLIIANNSTVKDISFKEKDIDVDTIFEDRIYKIWIDNNKINGKRLFRGDLNFNYKYPIESLSFYENTDLRKVYWTDGLNLPRIINIAAALSVINKWNNDTFNFVRAISLKEKITIKKNSIASGNFAPGVIQYAFTYFDKYGQETNIFYTSPLYYISYDNRGASPEDKVGNSFTINIDDVDTRFDYLRIYSIQRTSVDATAIVKRVVDLSIPTISHNRLYNLTEYTCVATKNNIKVLDNGDNADDDGYSYIDEYLSSGTSEDETWKFVAGDDIEEIILPYVSIPLYGYLGEIVTIRVVGSTTTISINSDTFDVFEYKYKLTYVDIGTEGDSVDPTELLYKGGENVIFGTMTLKDNTMFMGDIKLSNKYIESNCLSYIRNLKINFTNANKKIYSPKINGFYPYYNQLELNSNQIKTFKYLEWYRFGVQFQHYTGRWSEPIWVNDALNTVSVDNTFYNDGYIGLPSAYATFNILYIAKILVSYGYVNVRPIIVYPTLLERECICLGILCPTVYNVLDRYSNSPFVLSSWFVRPNAPFDINKSYYVSGFKQREDGTYTDDLQILYGDWANFIDSHTDGIYSRAGVLNNTHKVWNMFEGTEINDTVIADNVNYGAWAEFRHNHPIPDNRYRNAEILCISNPPLNIDISTEKYPTETDISLWVSQNSENYYIDLSIITLHSPDIEFDDSLLNIDTSQLKLRIIGIVPITAFASDIDIQTSTPVNNFTDSLEIPMGFYKEFIGATTKFSTNTTPNEAHFGWRSLISAPFWFDLMTGPKNDTVKNALTSFVVYPWHRNGSLNNSKFKPTDGERSAMLDKKRMSNIRYSYKSVYLPTSKIWKASYTDLDGNEEGGISGVLIFSSNEVSLVKLPAPKNSGLSDIVYYGNIDKLLSTPLIGDKKNGYPIIISAVEKSEDTSDTGTLHSMFRSNYEIFTEVASNECTGIDPIRMKYKSTPHAVMVLNYDELGWLRILPTIKDCNISDPDNKWPVNSENKNYINSKLFWDKTNNTGGVILTIMDISDIAQGPIDKLSNILHGWLWLGELYNDNILNRFGGTTLEAFENNLWIPCGEPVSLFNESGGMKSRVTVEWTEGDTYYQRYDHIKTYPFTLEDQNQMTDIVSFMCETRVNIDGRYDRNRGLLSNLAITPANFNQVNEVYSLYNNFFNYRGVNTNKLNLTKFNNVISWSKTKTAGELTDTWTNITLASSLDLDGDKGDIRALRRFNNNIYAFLDRGISLILYNETMQVSTTEGVPLEIANSGKVNGKRYITDKVGCTNKWSICETPSGLYFIDDITKGIFIFNGLLANISDKYGFHSWINSASKDINIWNPVDFDGFVSYYDKVNGDVFFINKDLCLAFSEPLGLFTSFYSYENTPYFINLEDTGIFTKMYDKHNAALWLHNQGDYNMFFDEYKPFYTTVIANPDMQSDKVFNNLEFRADSWDERGYLVNTTFDTLEVWNEYQHGITSLDNIPGRPSNLKRKFRIWRANIPRDMNNMRDRIRNPWVYIKLSKNCENTDKTILHDLVVHYFE